MSLMLLWRFEHVLLLVGDLGAQLSELKETGVLALLAVPRKVVVVGAVAVEGAPRGHWQHALGPALDALEALLRQAVLDAAAGLGGVAPRLHARGDLELALFCWLDHEHLVGLQPSGRHRVLVLLAEAGVGLGDAVEALVGPPI
eukprot:8341608-Pyramimonas_sp.AAC.1